MNHNDRAVRIALIAATLVQGGAEKQFVYAARALVRAGMEVRVYALNQGEYYEQILKDIGLTPIVIGRFQNPLIRLGRLIRELNRFQPDCVQSSHLFANLYASLAARAVGAISIGAVRSSLRYSYETNGAWTQWLVKSPHLLVTNSQSTFGELRDSRLVDARCAHLIPNAIDLSEFDGCPRTKAPEDITAIFVARLVPVKRVDNFLRALALARKAHRSFKGIIVGDGVARGAAEKLAGELNLDRGGVTFLGERNDVCKLLAESDMLVLSSDDEGFPNVLLEAMASRLPVVTTPAGDAKYVVDHGTTGFVVPFDNARLMAEKMITLAASQRLRQEMGEAGYRRVAEHYSLEHFEKKLLAAYHQINQGRPAQTLLPELNPFAIDRSRHSVKPGRAISTPSGSEAPQLVPKSIASKQRGSISVLMITSEWPTPESPFAVPFIVRQVKFLRRENVSVDVFHFRGNQNPLNYVRAWKDVRRTLRRNHYDLVHAQFGQSGALCIPKQCPLVVTMRGDDVEGIVGKHGRYTLRGYVLRVVSRLVAGRADAVILVSESLTRHLPLRSVEVIPSGLDFDQLPLLAKDECRKQLGYDSNKLLVLFVGDPTEERKRYRLARSAVELLDPSLNAELVVAWGVAHSEIPVYLNACDALVFTSMHEGSPNVVKEALACNLPVVSVDVGDVAERLSGLGGCILCTNDQAETLAEALSHVLKSRRPIDGRSALLPLDERILTQRVIAVYRSALQRSLEALPPLDASGTRVCLPSSGHN